MRHVHHWILESCLQSRPAIDRAAPARFETANLPPSTRPDIDGELYTVRGTRGNIAGHCKCGSTRTFHPFSGGVSLASWQAPIEDKMTRVLDEALPFTLA